LSLKTFILIIRVLHAKMQFVISRLVFISYILLIRLLNRTFLVFYRLEQPIVRMIDSGEFMSSTRLSVVLAEKYSSPI